VVIVTHPKMKPDAPCLTVEVDANDTPDFAADKVLDELAAAGAIAVQPSDYSPEEEERIRKRLSDLGYVE